MLPAHIEKPDVLFAAAEEMGRKHAEAGETRSYPFELGMVQQAYRMLYEEYERLAGKEKGG